MIYNQSPLPFVAQNGIQVFVNFVPAPVASIAFQEGSQQINIQIPWESSRDPLYVEVIQGERRAAFEGPYTHVGLLGLMTNWSVLFVDATGRAVVQHASDYSLVTPQNPARPGEYVISYGINLGPVTNVPKTGYAALASPLSVFDRFLPTWGVTLCSVNDMIEIQGFPVTPEYDGLAPGLVGVYQINFQIPQSSLSGDIPFWVQRTLTQTPLGPCSPSQPGFPFRTTTTATSVSALISIAP